MRTIILTATLLASLTLLSACEERAEQAAAPVENTSAAATGLPADADSVTRIVRALDAAATLKAVEERVRPAVESQVLVLYRGENQSALVAAKKTELLQKLTGALPEIESQLNANLRQSFTSEELEAIAAFLATPAGGKLAQKLPELKQNVENSAMQRASQLLSGLMQEQIQKQQEQNEEAPATNDEVDAPVLAPDTKPDTKTDANPERVVE
ncbi:MAG: DUF2059 domain-containing protein [Thalassospira sp.]|nr:DUF2059 domain-containing protein [Thalassospira sp.]